MYWISVIVLHISPYMIFKAPFYIKKITLQCYEDWVSEETYASFWRIKNYTQKVNIVAFTVYSIDLAQQAILLFE